MKNIPPQRAAILCAVSILLLVAVLIWQGGFLRPAPTPPEPVKQAVVGINVPPGDGQPVGSARLQAGGNAGLPPVPAQPAPGMPGWKEPNKDR